MSALAKAAILRVHPEDSLYRQMKLLAVETPEAKASARAERQQRLAVLMGQHEQVTQRQAGSMYIDPNEMRAVNALYGNAWLVLAAARHLTRIAPGKQRGSGKVLQRDVIAFLRSKLDVSAATIHSRWIKPFIGVLWGYDARKKALYPYAAAHRSGRAIKGQLDIVQHAVSAGRAELFYAQRAGAIQTDLPGSAGVYIALADTPKACCGVLLHAWHMTRKDSTAQIGRDVLCRLFGVTAKTLIAWEETAGVKATHVFADFDEADEHLTPDRARRAIPILVDAGHNKTELRWRAQWTNRYRMTELDTRKQKRSPRERRRAALVTLERALKEIPTTFYGEGCASEIGAPGGSGSFKAINFTDQQSRKGHVSAFERVRQHLRRTEDYSHPHTAFVGYDRRVRSEVVQVTTGELHINLRARLRGPDESLLLEAVYGGRRLMVEHLQERAQCSTV